MTTCQFTYDNYDKCETSPMPKPDKSSTIVFRGKVNGKETTQAFHPTTKGTFCYYHQKLVEELLEAVDYRHMRRSLDLMRRKWKEKK